MRNGLYDMRIFGCYTYENTSYDQGPESSCRCESFQNTDSSITMIMAGVTVAIRSHEQCRWIFPGKNRNKQNADDGCSYGSYASHFQIIAIFSIFYDEWFPYIIDKNSRNCGERVYSTHQRSGQGSKYKPKNPWFVTKCATLIKIWSGFVFAGSLLCRPRLFLTSQNLQCQSCDWHKNDYNEKYRFVAVFWTFYTHETHHNP